MPPTSAPVKPEVQFLLCCARNPLDSHSRQNLRQLLAAQLDWPFVFDLANDHGLLPLVCEHLLHHVGASVPPELSLRLSGENRNNSMRSLCLLAELFRVLDSLRRKGIPAAPYKGPSLAQQAYGSFSLRHFDDLDIVVAQESMPAVYDAMQLLNYRARLSRDSFLARRRGDIPGEYVFVHKVNRAMVEFHTEFTLRHFPHPPPIAQMLRRSVAVSINGNDVPAFSPADNLLMLSVHGAKDFWSRLVWVADVSSIVPQLTPCDWQQLSSQSERLQTANMVNLALRLARDIFDTPLPAEASSLVFHGRASSAIAVRLCEHLLERRPLPEGLWWRSRYRIAMLPKLVQGLHYWLRLSTAPAEEDWSAAPRASRSAAAYSLFRPLRLWRKHARSRNAEKLSSGGA